MASLSVGVDQINEQDSTCNKKQGEKSWALMFLCVTEFVPSRLGREAPAPPGGARPLHRYSLSFPRSLFLFLSPPERGEGLIGSFHHDNVAY